MHYYQHHIGDFIKDTANLNDHQLATYMRMVWAYYSEEKPFADAPEDIAFAMRSDEKTIGLILRHYFKESADGWRHGRCDREIAGFHGKKEKATASANARWSNAKKQAEAMPSQCHRSASARESNANQEPITNNQEPITKEDQKHLVTAVTDFDSFWKLYPRKTAKAEAQKAWAKLILDHSLLAAINAGLTAHIVCADWVKDEGKYISHASTWLNQRRWEDSPKPAGNVVKINRHAGFDQTDYSEGLQAREDGTNGF